MFFFNYKNNVKSKKITLKTRLPTPPKKIPKNKYIIKRGHKKKDEKDLTKTLNNRISSKSKKK